MSSADGPLAPLTSGPCYAVIFTSTVTADTDGYEETAEHMVALARRMPGFLGIESARDAGGVGITVSYWDSEAAIAGWRNHPEHVAAREQGNRRWYADYRLRVARVERAYAQREVGPPGS